MQNTNLQILPTKAFPGNLVADYLQNKQINEKQQQQQQKKIQVVLKAFTGNFTGILFNFIINRTLIDHAQID